MGLLSTSRDFTGRQSQKRTVQGERGGKLIAANHLLREEGKTARNVQEKGNNRLVKEPRMISVTKRGDKELPELSLEVGKGGGIFQELGGRGEKISLRHSIRDYDGGSRGVSREKWTVGRMQGKREKT